MTDNRHDDRLAYCSFIVGLSKLSGSGDKVMARVKVQVCGCTVKQRVEPTGDSAKWLLPSLKTEEWARGAPLLYFQIRDGWFYSAAAPHFGQLEDIFDSAREFSLISNARFIIHITLLMLFCYRISGVSAITVHLCRHSLELLVPRPRPR